MCQTELYTHFDGIHRQDYVKYIATVCKSIAKVGVYVHFTSAFMSRDELIDWCGDNDLNCFMYTRRQPGLSATTDQAIMSGRPLLTSSNDTFRHIHRYVPPYPALGLRQAIETTPPLVRRMQQDWSRKSFGKTFHRMLASFRLISLGMTDGLPLASPECRPSAIMLAAKVAAGASDSLAYSTRLADCLGRSGKDHVLRAVWDDLSDLQEQAAKLQPCAAILIDAPSVGREAMAAALNAVAGPKILLTDDEQRYSGRTDGDLIISPRRPLIPYFTSTVELRQGSPCVWLIGFAAAQSNLEDLIAKIARELDDVEIFLEVPGDKRSHFESRVAGLAEVSGVRLSVATASLTRTE